MPTKSLTDALRERLALPSMAGSANDYTEGRTFEHARTQAIVSLMLAVVAAADNVRARLTPPTAEEAAMRVTALDKALSRLRRAADEGE